MKGFPIEIKDQRGPSNFNLDDKAIIRKSDFLNFMRIARHIDVWDYVIFSVGLECDRCGSFVTDGIDFYYVIDDVLDFVEGEGFTGKLEWWEKMWAMLTGLKERLEEVDWLDDGFDQEREVGHVAIIFNPNCSCYERFTGKHEPEIEDEDTDFGSSPDDKVTKWIMPKKRLY